MYLVVLVVPSHGFHVERHVARIGAIEERVAVELEVQGWQGSAVRLFDLRDVTEQVLLQRTNENA